MKKGINPALEAYHAENRHEVIFDSEALSGKKMHVYRVIALGLAIAEAQSADVDMHLLKLCLEHHDDGRVDQLRWVGKFCDADMSHNDLGRDRLNRFLINTKATTDDTIEILRNVMSYHGRMGIMGKVSKETRRYVELVTAADDFENACSCVSYLVKEVENDEKGYAKSNPTADQREVSQFVLSHFKNGEKFDKMIYCHTYAEYVLFAATLATNCIKKYGEVARTALTQPGYGYETILEGFKDVFSKTLHPDTAIFVYETLAKMVNEG